MGCGYLIRKSLVKYHYYFLWFTNGQCNIYNRKIFSALHRGLFSVWRLMCDILIYPSHSILQFLLEQVRIHYSLYLQITRVFLYIGECNLFLAEPLAMLSHQDVAKRKGTLLHRYFDWRIGLPTSDKLESPPRRQNLNNFVNFMRIGYFNSTEQSFYSYKLIISLPWLMDEDPIFDRFRKCKYPATYV